MTACGGGDEAATTQSTSPPAGRAPSATGPPENAPESSTERSAPAPGGERRVRVPASFTLRDGRFVPSQLRVPAFLAVRISVASADGRAHTVTISADRTYRLAVAAGKRASIQLPGQPPGQYEVRSGGAKAVLEVGGG